MDFWLKGDLQVYAKCAGWRDAEIIERLVADEGVERDLRIERSIFVQE